MGQHNQNPPHHDNGSSEHQGRSSEYGNIRSWRIPEHFRSVTDFSQDQYGNQSDATVLRKIGAILKRYGDHFFSAYMKEAEETFRCRCLDLDDLGRSAAVDRAKWLRLQIDEMQFVFKYLVRYYGMCANSRVPEKLSLSDEPVLVDSSNVKRTSTVEPLCRRSKSAKLEDDRVDPRLFLPEPSLDNQEPILEEIDNYCTRLLVRCDQEEKESVCYRSVDLDIQERLKAMVKAKRLRDEIICMQCVFREIVDYYGRCFNSGGREASVSALPVRTMWYFHIRKTTVDIAAFYADCLYEAYEQAKEESRRVPLEFYDPKRSAAHLRVKWLCKKIDFMEREFENHVPSSAFQGSVRRDGL